MHAILFWLRLHNKMAKILPGHGADQSYDKLY